MKIPSYVNENFVKLMGIIIKMMTSIEKSIKKDHNIDNKNYFWANDKIVRII